MRLIIMAGVLVTLAACSSNQPAPMPNDPYYAPVLPEERAEPVVPTGSLYQAQYSDNMYSDIKARRLGDIITVTLQERTTASKSANAQTTKESNVDLPVPTILGQAATINGNPISANLGGTRDFTGDATADQSNRLSGEITVTVIRTLANGNLIVRGEKWLRINTGDEYIRLTGIIRPQDVSADNTIPSTRVANARIEYSGTGSLASTQEQGWLTRFFNSSYWPF
ncbi:flagellar basal body L-ring protein FlgH [Idiomarina baltica]|jgi:flagellar L-ring protein precursor FlgH|uniref:Flagellar L-ring protein n=3 Tax=Idiomarina TaxID=135575 RepID=A0A348WPZ6_9GAMM|nr:Flagellar basal body L-ring protein [Idiomarina baltica OS145]KXS35227.1 MAG: flagellar L-ring protein precursor FlgH [Idiomarina sp. T82-3]MAF74785.1 flagellar basal body L-ring protein [Idiomarinaceae bacterium]MBR38475.1 flagellar basal body L-ring protein [Idiomarina sp.]HAR56608.1 flagellar basal body L-ring protein FlgH [Idiomarina baltica]|tara:strand:+ start:5583 stop:6257 length:675 start_codon:yes stop_codon:yes gene_type:complete